MAVNVQDNYSSLRHTVRFGDVVRSVKVDIVPEESGLERYVAGEHMETDNLHITSWGKIGYGYLGPAFHRKFVKGQVLYGSRRTYLRKVAFAEFDGVCANTTLVLEPKDGRLLRELLPFIMQTEEFIEFSVKNSKGSVNPYINWSDLEKYVFTLPPLDEQRRIAEILWAADEAIWNYKDVLLKLMVSKKIVFEESLRLTALGRKVTLNDICEIQNGQVDPTISPYDQMIHIAPDDIESITGRILETKTASDDKVKSGNYLFDDHAILYSKIRPNLRKVAFPKFNGVCSADVYPIYPKDDVVPEFLFYLLLSEEFTRYAIANSVRSAIPKINRDDLLVFKFYLPNKEEQIKLVAKLEFIDLSKDTIQTNLSNLQKLYKALLQNWL